MGTPLNFKFQVFIDTSFSVDTGKKISLKTIQLDNHLKVILRLTTKILKILKIFFADLMPRTPNEIFWNSKSLLDSTSLRICETLNCKLSVALERLGS